MKDYSLDFNELNEVLRKVDIVKVIGSYITLTQKGRNYVGLCPFHDDNNPSLSISPEKRIYKCFVCGAGGNAITFVQDYEKIPFMKAVQTVGAITGLDMPFLKNYQISQPQENDEEKRLYPLLESIHSFYSFQLKVSAGDSAIKYLTKRNITEEIIKKFQIGFSLPDGKLLINYLVSRGFTIDEILKSGIATYTDGQAFDMMRERITFAIANHFGKIVAFSGRRFDDGKEQKYINSQDTPLFHKSKILYNFAQASLDARKKGYIYIVEGFMDVIALYRAGVENVVAVMGTALTSEHIQELAKLKSELRILFDSDRAGQIATLRALDLLENKSVKVKVVNPLLGAKDCDEYLEKNGADALNHSIQQLIDPFDYRLNFLKETLNLSNHDDRKQFVNDSIKHLANLNKSKLDEEYYIKKISEISGFSVQLVQNNYYNSIKLVDNKLITSSFQKKQQITNINRYEKAQRQIINKMIVDPLVIGQYQTSGVYMYDLLYRRICAYILDDFNRNGKVGLANIMTSMPTDLRSELLDIADDVIEPVATEVLFDTLRSGLTTKLEIQSLHEKMLETSDPRSQALIAIELVKQKQKYSQEVKERIEKDREGSKNERKS